MNDNVPPEKIDDILKTLDEALEQGPWQSSNFLRMIGKHLQGIRDDLAEHAAGTKAPGTTIGTVQPHMPSARPGQREVFIVLYTAEGTNLSAWERIIANLPRQMASRAVYADEEDARAVVRSRENRINEGYLVIFVQETDILSLPPEKTTHDRRGKPLLSLKDRSIQIENIVRFVHETGIYAYQLGRLVKTA